jgi:hypothetical protein
VQTLAVAFIIPSHETLDARAVLAHWHTTLLPRTCGHAVVTTVLTTCAGSLLQLIFCCAARLVVPIHDLLLASFLGDVVDVSSTFPYSGIRVILHSFGLDLGS